MPTTRLLRPLLLFVCLFSTLALLSSAFFRSQDAPLKDLKISSRWLSRSESRSLEGDEQAGFDGDNDERNSHDEASPDYGLTGDNGLLIKAEEKDWATAELTDEDLNPSNVDEILKMDWVYDEESQEQTIPDRGDYRELFSLTTPGRKFFPVYHENGSIYDATILPHPSRHDTWIVLAQNQYPESGQIVCESGFLNGVLICGEEKMSLPTRPSPVKVSCSSDSNIHRYGEHVSNARMFHGPDVPYVTYDGPSQHTCYGQHLQDGRRLLHSFAVEQFTGQQTFKSPTEVQQIAESDGKGEHDFLFWDTAGKAYIHHTLFPSRNFADLKTDGSVGPNLGSIAAMQDAICMAKYMPRVQDEAHEWIQQATNSLSITLCKRKDPFCRTTEGNTHLMHIFNLASNYDNHLIYEPYLLLFEQDAPFALKAISQRPFWIHGRDVLSSNSSTFQYFGKEATIPEGHTERFSVTGLSWKTHAQRYHGFLDDPILLGLGIEDAQAAGMDVLADDLLQDLALC